ncbi:MAG: pyruvate kinase [Parcubacteria group bacterium]|nr:pyruvate kinase [Parcubacteria group bacterium]
MKRTKIICTIGPATETIAKIRLLAYAGMNCARLNFSHGDHNHHKMLINAIRNVAGSVEVPIAIIQDLQGPRIRLGELPQDGIPVKRGDTVVLAYEKELGGGRVPAHTVVLPTQVPIGDIVKKGEPILIKDGLVRLRAIGVSGGVVTAEVEQGDVLTTNRGINLPESDLPDVVLTAKDKKDVAFGIREKIDWFALSFVRNKKDVEALRALLPSEGNYVPKIIAKIERKEAVKNFDEILEAADAIMIARGDLGIELPPEKIPLLQKTFIEKCLAASKPVIVATQMLESMTTNAYPTRAEVSDVANAVIDHTDAVMLSGETSTGSYPVEACRMMAGIIRETEASPYDNMSKHTHDRPPIRRGVQRIVAHMAEDVVASDHIRSIVVMSSSGTSARLVASERPEVPIVALTQNEVVRRQLSLSWGVSPYLMKRYDSLDELIKATVKLVKRELKVKKGEKILIASGHPTGPHGSLNLIKIHTV